MMVYTLGMRPMFTIHAGEYLLGSYIEEKFKDWNVWIPSKDSGIDFLVTNKKNNKAVSLQVKFSKDFLTTHLSSFFQFKLKSYGWWTLNPKKISKSPADFWVFVLYSHNHKDSQFIIIKPEDLLERLQKLHGNTRIIQHYLWVTRGNECWETRGLGKHDQRLIAEGSYSSKLRNFTEYLNNWDLIKERLK